MSGSVAVLTGDLVASSAAGPEAVDQAMAVLADAVTTMTGWTIGVDSRFTRWRGDGWQVLVRQPEFGLRTATYLMACLRAARLGSTRISLGIGGIDSAGTSTLADAGGPAFLTSGRALEKMRKTRRLTISGDGITVLHEGYGELMAGLIRRWSPEQAEAMMWWLHPDRAYTLADIAAKLDITPQAVNYRIKGADGNEIRAALLAWESSFEVMAGGVTRDD